MEKAAENGRKVNAIALLSCCFWPLFQKSKNGRKLKDIALLFCCFFPLSKIEKSAENGGKVKAI